MLSADLFNPSKLSLIHFSNYRSCRHSSPTPSSPFRHSLPFRRLRHLGLLRLSSNPNPEKDCHVRQLEIVVDDFVETGCSDLPVEICMTRTLDPALTLRHAVDAMKEALNRLKLGPPCSRSGVLRFQIVVPPSVKSLNWLSTQDKDLVAFPQFYIATKQIQEQFHGHTIMTQMLGASGVGSAITFRGSSDGLRAYNLMQRYLSFESPLIRTYGFIGIDPNMKPNLTNNQRDSFYFFIPQIEVNEFVNFSFLASNLVWDCSLSCTLEDAVNSLEISLHQH